MPAQITSQPSGGVQRVAFFRNSLVRSAAAIVSAMSGINHHNARRGESRGADEKRKQHDKNRAIPHDTSTTTAPEIAYRALRRKFDGRFLVERGAADSCRLPVRGSLMHRFGQLRLTVSDLCGPPAKELHDYRKENRCQENPEERDSYHPAEYCSTQCLPHFGARSRRNH